LQPNDFVAHRFGHGTLNGIYYSPFVGQNRRKEIKNQEEKGTNIYRVEKGGFLLAQE